MPLPYRQPGLTLGRLMSNEPTLVRALQHDLRALGYLRAGIDGAFGAGTESALRALQYDLLHNRGESRGGDGDAPVAIADFNRDDEGRPAVTALTGIADQALAGCIERLLADERVTKLPAAADPQSENRRALAAVAAAESSIAPTPFLLAIFQQESGGRHYRVPTARDEDNFVVVGLDRGNRAAPDQITSRGYGIGQYTLFHHPPRPEEIRDFILDPVRNVQKAYHELHEKFERFVAGPADRADDRSAEHPGAALRRCIHAPTDARYMRDCVRCAGAAPKIDITEGTPHFAGSAEVYRPDAYYNSASYSAVPDRALFPCDWPYAIRRYNGGGNSSYHYQARVLRNLLSGAP